LVRIDDVGVSGNSLPLPQCSAGGNDSHSHTHTKKAASKAFLTSSLHIRSSLQPGTSQCFRSPRCPLLRLFDPALCPLAGQVDLGHMMLRALLDAVAGHTCMFLPNSLHRRLNHEPLQQALFESRTLCKQALKRTGATARDTARRNNSRRTRKRNCYLLQSSHRTANDPTYCDTLTWKHGGNASSTARGPGCGAGNFDDSLG
jgi:hypothetical protein